MTPCRITTLIPLFLLLTIILTISIMSHESASPIPAKPTPESPHTHYMYSIVPNLFTQSLPTTNASTFNPLTSNLGLISRTYDTDHDLPSNATQWPRFTHYLTTLNTASPPTLSYRLLILSRHGEGIHNVAERFFGTEKWDCFYAGLEGSSSVTWADAELTKKGVEQARHVGRAWQRLVSEDGVMLPEAWYVSPLRRAVRTCEETWRGLMERERERRGFTPVVKEGLREGIGIHTCDRRSRKEEIAAAFPDTELEFEDGFPEDDPLWVPDLREVGRAQDVRVRGALDDVFVNDGRLVLSITSHGGTMASILRVVGHREFAVPTGGVIPVVVRVEVLKGERKLKQSIPWEGKPDCVGGEPGRNEVDENLRRFDESVKAGGRL